MTDNDRMTRIYHNPQCSKSRQTLQILNDNGVNTDVVEYLKQPPDVATLTQILDMLAIEPRLRDILRGCVQRGKIDAQLRYSAGSKVDQATRIDPARLKQLVTALDLVQQQIGIVREVTWASQ